MDGVGADQWRGWTFTTRDTWVEDVDLMRYRFGRSQDVIATVDSAQFAGDTPQAFAATLTSAPVPVFKQGAVTLSFDSHYRGAPGQSAVVTVSFDGGAEQQILRLDSSTVIDGYDGSTMNANETIQVPVPNGKKTAVFRWTFQATGESWYWAIDSVAVRSGLSAQPADRTSAWVVSDIQGHPMDLSHGLMDLHAVRPDASGLLMVGDIVNTGTVAE